MNKSFNNLIETILGLFVIGIAGYFMYYAYNSGQGGRSISGYSIVARFERIDGLNVGSDVKISGVKVGSVQGLQIDTESYQAKATLVIKHGVKIPTDSSAEIVSDGLLGGKYVAVVPGAEESVLKNKDEINDTQSSVSFEALLSKFLFSKQDDEKPKASKKKVSSDDIGAKASKKKEVADDGDENEFDHGKREDEPKKKFDATIKKEVALDRDHDVLDKRFDVEKTIDTKKVEDRQLIESKRDDTKDFSKTTTRDKDKNKDSVEKSTSKKEIKDEKDDVDVKKKIILAIQN